MKEINFEKIGKKLREIRIDKHLTQEYVAYAANVNTSHISNIENNRVKVSLTTLVHICNALETTVDYILAGEYLTPTSVLEQEVLQELRICSDQTKEQVLQIIKILQ